jgi:Zinc knuckle
MNKANGNKGENMKNNCSNCGKPGHYSKKCPEKKHNPLGQQQKLFVGYVGEDCVYMTQEEKPTHKTNRDWNLDTSSSDNSNNKMKALQVTPPVSQATTPTLTTTTTSS